MKKSCSNTTFFCFRVGVVFCVFVVLVVVTWLGSFCLDAFDSPSHPSLDAFPFDPTTYAAHHASWLSTKIDCTAFLTWFIEHYPESASLTRQADDAFWQRFK